MTEDTGTGLQHSVTIAAVMSSVTDDSLTWMLLPYPMCPVMKIGIPVISFLKAQDSSKNIIVLEENYRA